MQGGRGSGNPFFGFGDPFANFGGFGGPGGSMPGFFGGRDPFDDPFFTQPFGGMFQSNSFGGMLQSSPFGGMIQSSPFGGMIQSSLFGPSRNPFMDAHAPTGFLQHEPSLPSGSRGPIIEELNSDDEEEAVEAGRPERKENTRKHGRSGRKREPYVVDPDDVAEERRSKQLHYRNEFNNPSNTQLRPLAKSFTILSSSVTYGGVNGTYYTSSTTKRSGSDGLTFEEHKEADSATGQAAHRLSRGIHNQGHTVSRKLNSDGKVDTMQTLHNINEDELSGFEEAWNGKARKHLPGMISGVNGHEGTYGDSQRRLRNQSSLSLPSTEPSNHPRNKRPDMGQREDPGKVRADVGVKADSSSGIFAPARTNSKTESRRH